MNDAPRSADRPQRSRPTRLINVETLLLEDIDWANAAKDGRYAILSHTWGPEEVSFGEWQAGTATHKAGYDKIISACKVAKDAGEKYIWVDTCCIDKNNHSELSEAINSMFSWYAGASVCYAVLSDVTSTLGKSNALQQLRESRWFTRGWTLQELLASSKVEFFDGGWGCLGSRDSLLHVLAEVTGIDAAVLDHRKQLSRCSIAQRISWASRRSTTKPEDLAYCLLGILGVQMHLLYGEGQNAFRRLQEEILKSSGDLTVLAWRHVEPSRAGSLFASSPADFFGCGRVEADISAPLSSEHWMTSRGLKGTLSVVEHHEAEGSRESLVVLALLGCHEKGAPNDPATLRLTTAGVPLTQSDNVLGVKPRMDKAAHASLLSRLHYIKSFDLSAVRQVQATILVDGQSPRHTANAESVNGEGELLSSTSQEKRELAKGNTRGQASLCGMKRSRCILITAITLFILAAAIIGGAAGGILGKRKSSNGRDESVGNGLSNQSGTGTSGPNPSSSSRPKDAATRAYEGSHASLVSSDGGSSLYGYFQDPDGNIVELSFPDASFRASSQNIVVPAGSTYGGSPIAATTWTAVSGTTYRALFFQNASRMVMVTNTTGAQPWSEPYGILTNDLAAIGGVALAAGSDSSQVGLNGVRVYYSSAAGWIQEVGTDFSGFTDDPLSSPWYTWFSFPDSDPESGVGFAVSDGAMNVYVANESTATMQQWRWQYSQNSEDNRWKPGATGPVTRAGGGIVSTFDGVRDRIAYQDGSGIIQEASFADGSIEEGAGLGDGVSASPLSVTPISSGSFQGVAILYQSQDDETLISYEIVSDAGGSGDVGVWEMSVN